MAATTERIAEFKFTPAIAPDRAHQNGANEILRIVVVAAVEARTSGAEQIARTFIMVRAICSAPLVLASTAATTTMRRISLAPFWCARSGAIAGVNLNSAIRSVVAAMVSPAATSAQFQRHRSM